MKLVHDGDRQYHPATGLDLVSGEHDYPESAAEALIAAGLRRPAAGGEGDSLAPRAKKGKAEKGEEG